jgi:hypothetical protein
MIATMFIEAWNKRKNTKAPPVTAMINFFVIDERPFAILFNV